MQALDLVEQEQIDNIKSFFKRNGTLIIAIIVVLIAAYVGNRWMNMQHKQEALKAALAFEALEEKVRANDVAGAQQQFEELMRDYPKQSFSVVGALMIAKLNFSVWEKSPQHDAAIKSAITALEWAIKNGPDAWLRDLARMRLMHILFAQKSYSAMIEVGSTHETKAIAAAILELKGDAYTMMKKNDEAKDAYQRAINADQAANPVDGRQRQDGNPMLKMKLSALAK